ncbi:MAG: phosphate transporter, periplasmic phosphate-binding protein [Actinomycetia bacterium]|nr:phosphate transporter, periplasmic phosphate-binding protein [Actinomycetes bacterium]
MLRRKIAAGLVLAGSLLAASQTTVHGLTAQQVNTGVTVTGAGATFPLNIIEQWKADFKKSTGVTIAYTGVGSGAGRTQLTNGTVDFAGTDVLASPQEIAGYKIKYKGVAYVPETAGAIGITYKVKGVPGGIKLTGDDIGLIFAGKVAYWDDKVITDDNPGIDFPHTPVQTIVRSDKSGTSGNFTAYLAAATDTWTSGENQQFPTNNGQIGKAGSDGVANAVAAANGGITYTELSFIKERGLAMAQVKNASGKFQYADEDSAAKTIGASKVNADGTVTIAFRTTDPAAYPISAVTYLLIPMRMDAKKLDNLKAFVSYILGDGQKKAKKLSYVPLPAPIIAAAKAQMAKVTKK